MSFVKRAVVAVLSLAAVAAVAYFSVRVQEKRDFFNGDVTVTWTHNRIFVPGLKESIRVTANTPGKYFPLIVGNDQSGAPAMPTIAPMFVSNAPYTRTIEKDRLPDHVWVTIVSDKGLEVHEFP